MALVLATGCYSGLEIDPGVAGGDDPAGETAGGSGDEGGDSSGDSGGGDDSGDPESLCEEPSVGSSRLRRLTRLEYDNTIRDLFGIEDEIARTRFSPDEKSGGYASNDVAPVSATALDEYTAAAEDIASIAAEQVGSWVSCEPTEDGCPEQVIASMGLHVFRRPLEAVEVADYVALYDDARAQWDATIAYRLVIQAMLLSPRFLYHIEPLPEGAAETDVVALDPYALASRLSYFIWASKPDEELFDLAESGALLQQDELRAQVQRMLEDPRADDAIASFQRQWMQVEELDDKIKDAELFPQWNDGLIASMATESAAFAAEVILHGDARLRTMLTADWTIGDAAVAELYGAAPPQEALGVIELDGSQRAGVLTQLGFLAGTAHAAEPSWVYRGKFVRENVLCDVLPPPPPGVEINDPNDPGRLENPECAGCHTLIDPIGWGFDQYDAIGAFTEVDADGNLIDASGEVVGNDIGTFDGPVSLAHALAESPDVADCYAVQWVRYAARRHDTVQDECAVQTIQEQFAGSDGDIRELITAVVMSDVFRLRRAAIEE